MKKFLFLCLLVCACSGKENEKPLPPVCTASDTVFPESKIDAHTINVVPKVITKTDAASGAAISGTIAGAANVLTGGAVTPLMVLGSSAVGGLAGSTNKTTISTEEIRTCSFRVIVAGSPMVYFGDSQELHTTHAIAAFRKCTMLTVGDAITPTLTCVERNTYYPNGFRTYMWTSGPTAGFLY